MLKTSVSLINYFECLFKYPGNFRLQKNYFYTILDANTLKKEKDKKENHLKILKKSDKMNLTLFNTVESNIVHEK